MTRVSAILATLQKSRHTIGSLWDIWRASPLFNLADSEQVARAFFGELLKWRVKDAHLEGHTMNVVERRL